MSAKVRKPWFVYILLCQNGRLYTGITVDVEARFAVHCSGKGAMFTRLNRPARMLGYKCCKDRSEASRLETAIKKLPVSQKFSLAEGWSETI